MFSSHDKWVVKSAAVTLVPGPTYAPMNRVDERVNGGRGKLVRDMEGSPSKEAWNSVFFVFGRKGFFLENPGVEDL